MAKRNAGARALRAGKMTTAGRVMTGPNKRRSARLPCQIRVDIHTKFGARTLTTHDVSRHGVFIASPDTLKERHVIRLTIYLPSGPIETTAWVTRSVTEPVHGPAGAGTQFFSLNAEAKERWDAFFRALESGIVQKQQTSALPQSRPGAVDVASFVLKFGDKERLLDFEVHSVGAGGTFLVTPVLKPIGTRTQLIMVHPNTDEEYVIVGTVVRVHLQSPKGIEIHFHAVDADFRQAFHRFIETGTQAESSMNDAWTRVTTGMLPQAAILAELELLKEAELAQASQNQAVQNLPPDAQTLSGAAPAELSAAFHLGGEAEIAQQQAKARLNQAFAGVTAPPEQTAISQQLASSTDALVENAKGGEDMPAALDIVVGIPEIADDETFEWEDVSDELMIDLDIDDHLYTDFEITDGDYDELVVEETASLAVDAGPAAMERLIEALQRTHLRVYCNNCNKADFVIDLGDALGLLGLVARLRPYWCKRCNKLHTVPRLWPASQRRRRLEELDQEALEIARVSAAVLFDLADLSGPPRCPSCQGRVITTTATKAIEKATVKLSAGEGFVDTDAACPCCKEGNWTVLRVIR